MAEDATYGGLVRDLYAQADALEHAIDRLPLQGGERGRMLLYHAGTHLRNAVDAINAALAAEQH